MLISTSLPKSIAVNEALTIREPSQKRSLKYLSRAMRTLYPSHGHSVRHSHMTGHVIMENNQIHASLRISAL